MSKLCSPNPAERDNAVRALVSRERFGRVSEDALATHLGRSESMLQKMIAEGGTAYLRLCDLVPLAQFLPGILAELATAAGFRLVPLAASTDAADAQHATTAAQIDVIAATASVINACADGVLTRQERAACRPLIRRATASLAAVEAIADGEAN